METSTKSEFVEPPQYGLKLPLNHEFPLQSKQIIIPRPKQIFEMMPLTARYFKYYVSKRLQKKRPIMDYVHMISAQRIYGCPIGGIGGGTIGRGFKGEFCRFQLNPGLYEYVTVPECQFVVNIQNEKHETVFQSVLSTYSKPKKAPQSWEWNLNGSECEYTALYPRAWTTYDLSKYGIKLICCQISPVIPHNYKFFKQRRNPQTCIYKESGVLFRTLFYCSRVYFGAKSYFLVAYAWTTSEKVRITICVADDSLPTIVKYSKDSSLPCAVFVFSAVNVCNEHRNVNITFTWTEVLAGDNKKKTLAKLDLERYSEEYTCGVTLEQRIGDAPCTFTLAKRKRDTETIHDSYCLWNSSKTSNYVWDCLKKNGKLYPDPSQMPNAPKVNEKSNKENKNEEKEKHKKIHKCDSIALSSTISLDPGGSDSTEFCLVWDMPIVKYKKDKKIHKRYYTKYFGSDGIAGPSIAAYALRNYKTWEKQLAEWQDPILNNSNIPDWLKSALMNELYFVADGGTIWFDVQDEYPETDPRHDFGVFGYLEGHEYRMYNTYDVHFYASFALAQLWPNLQVVLQYMFLDSINVEEKKVRKSLYDGKIVKFKIKNSIPHDLGDPDDMPFTHINAYNIHDVSQWRDLNLKFILQVMRDYRLLQGHSAPFSNERYDSMAYIDDVRDGAENDLYSRSTGQEDDLDRSGEQFDNSSTEQSSTTKPNGVNDILELLYSATPEGADEAVCGAAVAGARVWGARRYLADMYGACAALLRRARQFDCDNDGLIENSGLPDQTYDAWVMTGPSAYCGGLWVASISVVAAMARILGFEEDEKEFSKMLEQARNSFEEKLWNGSFYRFDTKPSNSNVVMADQLAGHWFLRASGWTEAVFPDVNVKKALQCIYENNVLRFMDGRMGAVNGFHAGGKIDTTALQSEEVWTGVTYSVAALMIHEGLYEQAFVTAGGLCDTLMKMGLSFETPEALYENGNHRSVAYMRPLAIWAMYQALTTRPPPAANGQVIHEKPL